MSDRDSKAKAPSTGLSRADEADRATNQNGRPHETASPAGLTSDNNHTHPVGGTGSYGPQGGSNREREGKKDGPGVGDRLKQLLRTSVGSAITFDENGTIESLDGTVEMLLGYSSKELIGHSVVEILTTDSERSADETDCPVRLRRKDGSSFPAKLTLGRNCDGGRYVGVIHPDPMRREPTTPPPVTRVSEERRRIGRELHDTVGQELSGVALMGGALIEAVREHERECARLGAKVVDGVRRAMDQVRVLMTGLAPVEVRGDELAVALDELAARVRTSHAVACTFREDGDIGVPTVATATHLYLIAQEAVTNALKHSQAKAIAIHLSAEGDSAVLRVTDDGTGFDDPVARNPNGMGLRIMRERAGMIGGDLRIDSAPGTGTSVTCILRERIAHDEAEEEEHRRAGPPEAGERLPAGRQGDDR